MDYYPLGDLQAYLDDNSMSEDGARQIIVQILQGLAVMHGEGYAHRDIKPQVCESELSALASGNQASNTQRRCRTS